MRCLVQRVSSASVRVHGEEVGAIGAGLCVLVGITHGDDEAVCRRMADKVVGLRILADDHGRMNRSLAERPEPEVLVVSQFTLYGSAQRGRRPSFGAAARPEVARALVDTFVEELRTRRVRVATGRFGADMEVALVNDGPVTLMLELSA